MLAPLLISLGIQNRHATWADSPLWGLQQSSHLKAVILDLLLAGLAGFLAYALVGILAIQWFQRLKSDTVMAKSSLLLALIMGIGLSAVVSTAASGPGLQWPNFGALKEERDAGTPVIAAIDVDDYSPETGDLPESIPQPILNEIDQRIANCALYQEWLGTL